MDPLSLSELTMLSWDETGHRWQGNVTLPSGHQVNVSIHPEPNAPLPSEAWLGTVSRRVRWVMSHEPTIRGTVAEKLFDGWWSGWRDEEIDAVTSKEEFANAMSLAGINLYGEPVLELVFNDGDLFGGHGIVMDLGEDGQILTEPNLSG